MSITRWCSECAADAAFERFDCADHPEDCIELVCVLCGAGIELALVPGTVAGTAGTAGAAGAAKRAPRRVAKRAAPAA